MSWDRRKVRDINLRVERFHVTQGFYVTWHISNTIIIKFKELTLLEINMIGCCDSIKIRHVYSVTITLGIATKVYCGYCSRRELTLTFMVRQMIPT